MKIKRFLGLVLKLAMVLSLMPMIAWAEASQSTIGTYSIFDVIIPFENAVDCQRTTEKTIGKLQQVNQFNYVCAASDNGIRINKLDLEVTSNPQNYYYRFSRSENYEGTIALTLYKYDDSTYSYLVSDNGYIQSYGENCFIYNERIKKKLTTVKMALKRLFLYLQRGKGRVKFTHNRLKGEATLLKKERKLWKEKALSPTLAS